MADFLSKYIQKHTNCSILQVYLYRTRTASFNQNCNKNIIMFYIKSKTFKNNFMMKFHQQILQNVSNNEMKN